MLFDDEILYIDESDDVKKSPICTNVPLKTNISLKDLWIPSGLLINRKKAMDSNRNRPYIYHTLYKPDAESFSVYIDDSKDSTGNEHLNTFELHNSHEKNLSKVPSTVDTDSSKLCFPIKDENSEQYFPKLSFSDEDENFVQDSPKLCSDKDKNSEQELKHFLELLNRKSPSHESKTECHDMDKSANLKNTIHTKKETKVENLKQYEPILDTLNSESPIAIEDEKEKFENFLNAVNVEKQYLDENVKKQKHCLDTLNSEIPLHEAKMECRDKENSGNFLNMVRMEKMCADSMASCSTEAVTEVAVTELPVAYQKHSFRDPPTKQKNQKEKKKKNAVNKSIKLGDFLQIPDSDGYVAPDKDEFYDNLVRQGICVPRDLPCSTNFSEAEYYRSPTQRSFIKDFPKENGSLLPSNACGMSSFKSIDNIQSCGVQELEDKTLTTLVLEEKVQSCGVEELEDKTLTTLVLENISCDISTENVESLMSTYGEIKDISFETVGNSLKANVKLVLEHDVEWIMECLNGYELFGASSGLLKCYQLKE